MSADLSDLFPTFLLGFSSLFPLINPIDTAFISQPYFSSIDDATRRRDVLRIVVSCFVMGLVALVLAGNAPFYPLYVIALAGSDGMPWLLMTLLAFPVFLMVPAIARRHPLAGRITLSLAGTIHTVSCSWVLGEKSGTERFLIPCVALAGLLFGVGERIWMLLLLVGFVLLARRLGVANRASLGYGLPRRAFLREAVIALGLGDAGAQLRHLARAGRSSVGVT